MTDVINSALEMSHQLDDDLSKARESLRSIDEGIKSLTGRSAVEFSRFNRGGGAGGGQPARVQYQMPSRNEPFEGNRGFAGSKRRVPSFGAGRGEEDSDVGWKRPRMSYDFQDTSNFAYQNDPFDDDVRGPQPTIPSSVTVTQKDLKSRDEAIAELKTSEKRDVAVRNRRMFGVLLGTLQKFKKDEDTKIHTKEQEKRQKEIEYKLEEAKRKDHIELQKQKEKLLEQRRRQQAELRRLQRKKALIAATENQMAQLKRLQNFIQTNSKPPIFYMPLKHTIRTIELQKKSQKRLEEMIKRKQEEMEQELKFIDDLQVTPDSDDDEQVVHDAQVHEGLGGKIKSEASGDVDEDKSDVGKNPDAVVDAQVPVEPKTIQDELNELTNAAAANYELHFEEDDQQAL